SPQLRDLREILLAFVGLVEDVEVLFREANASEAVGASAAFDAAHEVSAADAALAVLAVGASEASGRAARMGALGAIDAADAVVRSRDVPALFEERRVGAALAPLAREAADVRAHPFVGTRQLLQALFELGGRH